MNMSRGVIDESGTTTDTSHSVYILLAFFIAILSVFGIGIGLSYLCYQHALKRKKDREIEEQQRVTLRRRSPAQQEAYRAIHTAGSRKGIPNWYSPNPKDKDENAHLLYGSIIPVHPQMQEYNP